MIVTFLVSIVRVKLYAVFLGPIGFGLISQFLTFINLITSTVHIGSPFALSSILPSLYKNDEINSRKKIYYYFKFFTAFFFIITLIVSIIIILLSDYISYLLIDSVNENYILKILAFSIPFTVIYAIFEAFLRSSGQINKMVRVTIITALITIPTLIYLIYYYNLEGVAYYIVLSSLVPFIIMFFYFNKQFVKDDRKNLTKLSTIEIKNVFKAGVTTLFAFLFNQLVILYLRKFIISNFSNEDNGLYQSALGLSMNLFAFMYSFLGNHTLTQMSMYKIEGKDDFKLNTIINDTAKFILILIIPLLVLIFSYRNYIIILLYSDKFIQAGNLFLLQFIGDSFRIFASLFSLWLFSRMKIRALIVIDLIFNFSLFSFPNILILFFPNDLRIVPFSYMVASGIQFILFFVYTKSSIQFQFLKNTKKYIIISIIILSFIFTSSTYFQEFSLYLSWFVLLIWALLLIYYIEKISITNIIQRILIKYKDKL